MQHVHKLRGAVVVSMVSVRHMVAVYCADAMDRVQDNHILAISLSLSLLFPLFFALALFSLSFLLLLFVCLAHSLQFPHALILSCSLALMLS